METNGVITKLEHPESKAKVLYQLTEKGIDLLPVMIEIYLWGDKYFTLSDYHVKFIAQIKKDKEAFIDNLTKKLKKEILGKD